MTSDRGLQGVLRTWLHEDRHEDATRVLHTVLDGVATSPQHRPRRSVEGTLTMNKFLAVGLGAAAVVAVLLIGSNLLGSGSPPGGEPSPSLEPSEAPSEPAPSSWVGVPAGPFLWFDPTDPPNPLLDGPPITITIPASGWTLPDWEGLEKGDAVDNVPESWLLYASTTAGILVYGDPCQWADSTPETPATTADEVVAALAGQPSRDAAEPVDVTLGGFPGQMITVHVPDDAVFEGGTFGFSDCDDGIFASYEVEGQDGVPWRLHQGPGQIDEFWVVDVDGAIVIIDAAYRPDTSTERIEEMHTMIESATFD